MDIKIEKTHNPKRLRPKEASLRNYLLLVLPFFLSSCLFLSDPKNNSRRISGGINNSFANVASNNGRILTDNPIILSGDSNLSDDVDLNTLLPAEETFITSNSTLTGSCSDGITDCYNVLQSVNASALAPQSENKWAFDANSSSFLQVHSFAHIGIIVDKFHSSLSTAKINGSNATSFTSSIPSTLFSGKKHWVFKNDSRQLTFYSEANNPDNASYSPAFLEIRMGSLTAFPKVKTSQDPTIIYHELGHTFNQILINQRNSESTLDLGDLFYDEAGAIGEALADLFSYFVNKRTFVFEWGLGRFLNAGRPLSESQSIHAPGISTSSTQRLSYPKFVTYDPNNPGRIFEDIHYSGQIISHYLIALIEDLISTCNFSQDTAIQHVFSGIAEVFAEMGDLSAKGNDASSIDNINLDSTNAALWARVVTPVNFRRFTQGMARFLKGYLGDSSANRCNGGIYTNDKIEQLLDNYGLLLFKTYNEDLNNYSVGHSGTHTAININNRQNSILIPKDLLILDPTEGEPKGFVFDKRADMIQLLNGIKLNKGITLSDKIDDDLPWNNGNGKISPGELVGISPNLYNNSNSTMGGVQLLANDWDHIKGNLPCNNFSDSFPADSEGAADSSSETTPSTTPGDCNYITRSNGNIDSGQVAITDPLGPVCFVQKFESDAAKWVVQEKLREELGVPATDCLDGDNTNSCFARVLPGTEHAYFSVIAPKKTWAKTFSVTGTDTTFTAGNIILLEINPSTPPGTTFNCRFRARFTNCDDCWTDSDNGDDDFLDYEYSGGKPFQIINFQFNVID